MRFIYGGDTPTIHPELGLLQPGENEIPERRRGAVEQAIAAGLPLLPVQITRTADGARWDDSAEAWLPPPPEPEPAEKAPPKPRGRARAEKE